MPERARSPLRYDDPLCLLTARARKRFVSPRIVLSLPTAELFRRVPFHRGKWNSVVESLLRQLSLLLSAHPSVSSTSDEFISRNALARTQPDEPLRFVTRVTRIPSLRGELSEQSPSNSSYRLGHLSIFVPLEAYSYGQGWYLREELEEDANVRLKNARMKCNV